MADRTSQDEHTAQQERKAIEKAQAGGLGLANWPPSRGPEPPGPVIGDVFPEPEVMVASRAIAHTPLFHDLKAPSPHTGPLVPNAEARLLAGESVSMKDLTAHADRKRFFSLSVWADIADLLEAGPKMCHRLVVGFDSADGSESICSSLPARTYSGVLAYPLSPMTPALVTIGPARRLRDGQPDGLVCSVGFLLWSIASAYSQVYQSWERYGVWGHAIGDLNICSLRILDDSFEVEIGS